MLPIARRYEDSKGFSLESHGEMSEKHEDANKDIRSQDARPINISTKKIDHFQPIHGLLCYLFGL